MEVGTTINDEQMKKALNYLQQGIVNDMEYFGLQIHHYDAIGGGMVGMETEDTISFIMNPPEEQMRGKSKEDYQRDFLEAIYSHMEDLMDCLNRERLHRILKSDDSDAVLSELGFGWDLPSQEEIDEEMKRVQKNSKHLL
jgi:hypothetical protein